MHRRAAYAVLALASAATLAMVFALKPSTAAVGIALAAWLLLPYALLALAVRYVGRSEKVYATLAVVVPVGAVAFLAYLIYVRPDAQGAIAVLFTPIYELVALGVLLALVEYVGVHR